MDEYGDEINLMDYLNVLWKRKWLIIIPTLIIVVAVGVYSFFLPRLWEVDAIIQPSKFFIQTEEGEYREIIVINPKQIIGPINEAAYNRLIAEELNMNIRDFPNIKAENLQDTNFVRVSVKEQDVKKAKSILLSLFNHLKKELDKKIDVEIKGIDTRISTNQNLIKHKELLIEDNKNEIKLKQIEKNKIQQEILSAENKLKISDERVKSILDEMKEVKKRIDELEKQQKEALAEKKEEISAISLLLYSNEVQHNLRYYNTLDEKLSTEKITKENLSLLKKEKNEETKQLDTLIEKLKTEIDKINNEIDNVKNQINLLNERKSRIDKAQLIKEPTSSLGPVAPKKRRNIVLAGTISLIIFTFMAFFVEYVEKQKSKG